MKIFWFNIAISSKIEEELFLNLIKYVTITLLIITMDC